MYIWERETETRREREGLGCTVRVAWRRTVLDERENGWTTFWDSTHGSVCVCLWSIGWNWLHYIHMGGGGGVSKHIRRCLSFLINSGGLSSARVCSPWTHVWMFLGSFLHIPTLWHVGSLNVIACKVTLLRHCCTKRHRAGAVPLLCALLCVSFTAAFFRRLTRWIIYGTNEFAVGCRCSSESMQVMFSRLRFHRN